MTSRPEASVAVRACPGHHCRPQRGGASGRRRAVPGAGTLRYASGGVYKKDSPAECFDRGTRRERQLPTLPPGGAVPSAPVSLTSLFGMGRGGTSRL